MAPIANYTTTVSAETSIKEIQQTLAKAGARSILTDYDDSGEISTLSFQLVVGHQRVAFRLPSNVPGVQRVLTAQKVGARYLKPAHVRNVAWRIVRDWVRAQMAIVEAEQATFAQLMLPHALVRDGRTLADTLEAEGPSGLLLTEGRGEPSA